MSDNLQAIVRGLSERERRAITSDWSENHPMWGEQISCWGDQSIADELYRLGLTTTPKTLTPLSRLGLRVRALLQEKD